MKIALLISGYLRGYSSCIPSIKKYLLEKYNVDVYLHITKYESTQDKYQNEIDQSDVDNIISLLNPVCVINEPNLEYSTNKKENDIINQWAKVYKLHSVMLANEENLGSYDLVIRYRPDVLFNQDIFENIEKYNDLSSSFPVFIPKDSKINGTKSQKRDCICDAFAIGNRSTMSDYCSIYNELKNLVKKSTIPENILYLYLEKKLINYNLVDIDYTFVLSKCSVFAICGDSGSGKTTLSNLLKQCFSNSFTLECDRYHKWERGNDNWSKMSHLNPEANYIVKMQEDVFNLKSGKDVFQVDYDHSTGKFTDKQHIKPTNNLIVCGLHSLYNNHISDVKIYMDTEEELKTEWKRTRDIKERGYTQSSVDSIIESRKEDYTQYVHSQISKADLITRFYKNNGKISLIIAIRYEFCIGNILDSLLKNHIKYEKLNLYDGFVSINFDDYISFPELSCNGTLSNSFYDYIIYFAMNMRKK